MDTSRGWGYLAREYYWTHPRLQRGYARMAAAAARRSERRGDLFAALTGYCDATRRMHPRLAANAPLRQAGLRALGAFVQRANGGDYPATQADNRLIPEFLASEHAEGLRRRLRTWTHDERLRLRGNLMVLKAPREGERGVLLIFFTHASEWFLTAYDVRRVFERFTVVLEPSWGLCPEPYWAYYAARDTPALCQAMTDETADAIGVSGMPLVPLRFGAQDWVDENLFRPLGREKQFDVIMVANFAKLKRHTVLYKALRAMPGPPLKVALVGHAWERTQEEFEAEMRAYGVDKQCTLYRNLEADQVNEMLNRSRVAVLLTRIEGGNRALMEATAAGVPAVVYRYIVGPRLSQINPQTGLFADDHELGAALREVLADPQRFQPRRWFEANSGSRNMHARLNQELRRQAALRGEPWTQDIAAKVNNPMPDYANAADAAALAPVWRELDDMMIFK